MSTDKTELALPHSVERIMYLADTMASRYAARDIPTGGLYRGIAERHWREARDELRAALEALTSAPPAQPQEPRALIEECRAALAEELSAWDIDPPLHHVKQAHDKCVAWLAAAPQAPAEQPAAQQELQAQSEPRHATNWCGDCPHWCKACAAEAAERAAQQEPQGPKAWCALTPSGKIAYFDGKPMVMVGPVGNEHHPDPLYASPPRAVEQVARELAALREALQEADTIMGHDDVATEWREKWASLWSADAITKEQSSSTPRKD